MYTGCPIDRLRIKFLGSSQGICDQKKNGIRTCECLQVLLDDVDPSLFSWSGTDCNMPDHCSVSPPAPIGEISNQICSFIPFLEIPMLLGIRDRCDKTGRRAVLSRDCEHSCLQCSLFKDEDYFGSRSLIFFVEKAKMSCQRQ